MAYFSVHLPSGARGGTCRGYVLKDGVVSATFDLDDGSQVTLYGSAPQMMNLAIEFIQVAASIKAESERREAEEAARGAKAETGAGTGAETDSEEDQVNIETFGK